MKFRALTYLAISIVTAFSNLVYADGATLEHLSFSDAKTFFSSNNRELILAKPLLWIAALIGAHYFTRCDRPPPISLFRIGL